MHIIKEIEILLEEMIDITSSIIPTARFDQCDETINICLAIKEYDIDIYNDKFIKFKIKKIGINNE